MGHNMFLIKLVLAVASIAHAGAFPPPLDLRSSPGDVQEPHYAPAHLLKAFGLSEPGVRGWHAEPPQYMLDLYNQIADSSGLTRVPGPYGATVIRAFAEREDSDASNFVFSFAGLEEQEEVLEAEFHVFHSRLPKTQRHLLEDNTFVMEVEEITTGEPRVLQKQYVAAHTAGWRVFKLGPGLTDLQVLTSDHQSHIALAVRASTSSGHALPVKFHHGVRGARQPLLVLFNRQASLNDTHKQEVVRPDQNEHRRPRKPRSVGITGSSSLTMDCERSDMYVDFESIGWASWIVYPKGYNAYQCSGRCKFPLGQNLNPTNHATVQSIMHHAGGYPRVAEPCCVPSTYANLSLLFYDAEENIVLRQYDEMVALQCGCH